MDSRNQPRFSLFDYDSFSWMLKVPKFGISVFNMVLFIKQYPDILVECVHRRKQAESVNPKDEQC